SCIVVIVAVTKESSYVYSAVDDDSCSFYGRLHRRTRVISQNERYYKRTVTTDGTSIYRYSPRWPLRERVGDGTQPRSALSSQCSNNNNDNVFINLIDCSVYKHI
ncbi:unnamed protein product, partial [Ixodes pacificus]